MHSSDGTMTPPPSPIQQPSTPSSPHAPQLDPPLGDSHWDRLPAEVVQIIFDWTGPLTRLVNGVQTRSELRAWRSRRTGERSRLAVWQEAIRLDWDGDLNLLPDVELSISDSSSAAAAVMLQVRSRISYHRLCFRFPNQANGETDADLDEALNHYGIGYHGGLPTPAASSASSLTEPTTDHTLQQTRLTQHAKHAKHAQQTHAETHAHAQIADRRRLGSQLRQIPMHNCWLDVLDLTSSPIAIGWHAILFGHASLLHHLAFDLKAIDLAQYSRFGSLGLAMDLAATHHTTHVLDMLHGAGNRACSTAAMDWAASHGALDTVIWLHTNRTEGCTTEAMDGSAAAGHLHVVQWLHANRTEGCTTRAMESAAKAGHLDVVAWLHANRTEGCTSDAMDLAAEYGHLDVLQFLHENRSEGCTVHALTSAAERGDLDVVEYVASTVQDAEMIQQAMNMLEESGEESTLNSIPILEARLAELEESMDE